MVSGKPAAPESELVLEPSRSGGISAKATLYRECL